MVMPADADTARSSIDDAPQADWGERFRNLGKKLDPRTGNGPTVVKLLLYAAVCFALLGALFVLIGNRAWFADRAGYSAEVGDATGLFESDSVRISGVPVGRVTSIGTERGVAVIEFELDDHIELPADTQVGVRWRNVLGQKYLYLYPGSSSQLLEPGARIGIDQAIDQADFGRFLNEIGPVLRAVDPADGNAFTRAFAEALEGNEEKARRLLTDAADVTGAVGELDTELGTIITQLEDLLTAIAQRDGDLASIIDDLGATADTLAENNAVLTDVIDSFTEVQEQLRQVVEGNRPELDQIIENLVVIGDTLDANLASLEEGLATLPPGLAAYHEVSSAGQWFNVRARILCFAGQQTCVTEETGAIEPLTPGGPAQRGAAGSAGDGRPGRRAADDPMAGSLDDWLNDVAGGGR